MNMTSKVYENYGGTVGQMIYTQELFAMYKDRFTDSLRKDTMLKAYEFILDQETPKDFVMGVPETKIENHYATGNILIECNVPVYKRVDRHLHTDLHNTDLQNEGE